MDRKSTGMEEPRVILCAARGKSARYIPTESTNLIISLVVTLHPLIFIPASVKITKEDLWATNSGAPISLNGAYSHAALYPTDIHCIR